MSDNPLLRAPTEDERKLIEVVIDDYIGRADWPNWQYVEAILFQRHHLEARPILAHTPRISVRNGIGRYGWFRTSSTMFDSPQPSDSIALSISGMARSVRGHPDTNRFVATLRYLAERQRTFQPVPNQVQEIKVSSDEIRDHLSTFSGVARWQPTPQDLERIAKLIGEEPSTWNCAVEPQGDRFVVTLAPFIRPYFEVDGVEDYVERLVAEIAPSEPSNARSYPHGLALPEAIDYLNAVWRGHAKAPLITIRRAEAAARLAFECNSAEQFEAQLSGLCQLFDGLELPGVPGAKLNDFDAYLKARLPEGSYLRAQNAIVTLRALFTLRAWRQHAADDRKWREAAQQLRVSLPTADWNDAWRRVHLATIDSLATIREELDGLVG